MKYSGNILKTKAKWAERWFNENPNTTVDDVINGLRIEFGHGIRYGTANKIRNRVRARLTRSAMFPDGTVHQVVSKPVVSKPRRTYARGLIKSHNSVVEELPGSSTGLVREAVEQLKSNLEKNGVTVKHLFVSVKNNGSWDIDVAFMKPETTKFEL